MTWGVWCEVRSGITGNRAAWLKINGAEATFPTEAEAIAAAARCQAQAEGRPSHVRFHYRAKERTREEITGGGETMTTRRRYHFNLGDSDTGPIGYCAEVIAPSRAEALAALVACLHEDNELDHGDHDGPGQVERITAYLNPAAITEAAIDEVSSPLNEDDEEIEDADTPPEPPPPLSWNADDQRQAESEGWAIFNEREIQRDDEAAVFASDDDALRFIRFRADHGSQLHRRALAIHEEATR